MRVPNGVHTSRPWRIHALTGDFRLEDVWALPTPGGPGDFPRLVAGIASGDPGSQSPSRAARALWAEIMRDQYGAQSAASWKLRFHAQTAGCTLQAQQPQVNLIRVAYQAMAAVLGGSAGAVRGKKEK